MESGYRVKLYFLNGSSWADKGTGFARFKSKDDKFYIYAKSELDDSLLIEHEILANLSYHRQQETLILWTNSDGDDIALSFQEKRGRDNLWAKICQVLGKDPNDVEIDEEVEEEEDEEEDVLVKVSDPSAIIENFISEAKEDLQSDSSSEALPKLSLGKRKNDFKDDEEPIKDLSPEKKSKIVSSVNHVSSLSDFQHHSYFQYQDDFDDSDIDKYSSPFITETLTSSNYLTNSFSFFEKSNVSSSDSNKDFTLNTLNESSTTFLTSNSVMNSTFTSASMLSVGFDDGPVLPECDIAHLAEIESLITEYVGHGNIISLSQASRREKLSMAIEHQNYVPKLLETFRMCEDLEDLDGLHHMYTILKNLFLLNRNAILEILLADDSIVDVIGCLEYDPSLPLNKNNVSLTDSDSIKLKPLKPDQETRCLRIEEQTLFESNSTAEDLLTAVEKYTKVDTDEHKMDVVEIEENEIPINSEPEMISFLSAHKQNHREYILKEAKFKEAVPITNKELLRKIHQTYRVQYIQDVIFPQPSIFEENVLSSLTSFIFFNKLEIVNYIQEDDQLLRDVYDQLSSDTIRIEQKRNLILFFKEFCLFSQTLQSQSKENFIKAILNKGILVVLESLLPCDDDITRNAIIDILWFLVEFNPTQIREFAIKECQSSQEEDTYLINVLIEQMICDPDPELGNAMQISLILKTIADPDNMSASLNKSEKTEFLSLFYKHNMHILVAPLLANTTEAKPNKDDYRTAHLLSIIIEILSFYAAHHTFHSKNYFINKDLLKRTLVLMESRHHFLVLCALRLLRNIVNLKDEFYNRYIIKGTLFKPVIEAFVQNGSRYNLLNSAVLELFDFLYLEDTKSLIINFVENFYLTKKYGLEEVNYVEVFKKLKIRYDQVTDGGNSSLQHGNGMGKSPLLQLSPEPNDINSASPNINLSPTPSKQQQNMSNAIYKATGRLMYSPNKLNSLTPPSKKSPNTCLKPCNSPTTITTTTTTNKSKSPFGWEDEDYNNVSSLFNTNDNTETRLTTSEEEAKDLQSNNHEKYYDEELERRQEDAWFDADDVVEEEKFSTDSLGEKNLTDDEYGPPVPLPIKQHPKEPNNNNTVVTTLESGDTNPTLPTSTSTTRDESHHSPRLFKKCFSGEGESFSLLGSGGDSKSADQNNSLENVFVKSQDSTLKQHRHISFTLSTGGNTFPTSKTSSQSQLASIIKTTQISPHLKNEEKASNLDISSPAVASESSKPENSATSPIKTPSDAAPASMTGKVSPIPSLVAYEEDSEEELEEEIG